MKKRQHLSNALMILLLTSVSVTAASCADETPAAADTTPVDTVVTEKETEVLDYIDTVPESVHYEGTTFRMAWSSPFEINEIYYTLEDAAGDIVSEAVYERNRMTEEKLGITITGDQFCRSWGDGLKTLRNQVEAGDCPYDAIFISGLWCFEASLDHLVQDMSLASSIDFTHEWWDTEALDMYSFGTSKRFYFSGDINFLDDYALNCFFFNKRLCDDYDLESPYQVVKDGRWTFDKLYEYCINFGLDLNGDNVMNEEDLFGMAGNEGILNTLLCGAGENIILVDNEGMASLNTSERIFNIMDDAYEKFVGLNNPYVCIAERKLGYGKGSKLFPTGHAFLVENNMIGHIAEFRMSSEDDFGVIPIPKFEEAQESYHSLLNLCYGTTVAVPITTEDLEKTGWILDIMGYYSHDTIYPAVIEKNIKTKSTRDEESIEMIELIFDTKFFELGNWGSAIYDKIYTMAGLGKNTYASAVEKCRGKTEEDYANIPSVYFE